MKPDGQSSPPSAQWFPFSFSNTRLTEKISIWLDRHLFGGGPGKAGIEVGADEIRIRGVADFRLDIPWAYVRSVARFQFQTRGWLRQPDQLHAVASTPTSQPRTLARTSPMAATSSRQPSME